MGAKPVGGLERNLCKKRGEIERFNVVPDVYQYDRASEKKFQNNKKIFRTPKKVQITKMFSAFLKGKTGSNKKF